MRLRFLTGLLIVLAAALPAALSAAPSPAEVQYANDAPQVVTEQTDVAGATAEGEPTLAAATLGALPFTGLELAFAFALGAALVVVGLVLRGRRRDKA